MPPANDGNLAAPAAAPVAGAVAASARAARAVRWRVQPDDGALPGGPLGGPPTRPWGRCYPTPTRVIRRMRGGRVRVGHGCRRGGDGARDDERGVGRDTTRWRARRAGRSRRNPTSRQASPLPDAPAATRGGGEGVRPAAPRAGGRWTLRGGLTTRNSRATATAAGPWAGADLTSLPNSRRSRQPRGRILSRRRRRTRRFVALGAHRFARRPAAASLARGPARPLPTLARNTRSSPSRTPAQARDLMVQEIESKGESSQSALKDLVCILKQMGSHAEATATIVRYRAAWPDDDRTGPSTTCCWTSSTRNLRGRSPSPASSSTTARRRWRRAGPGG